MTQLPEEAAVSSAIEKEYLVEQAELAEAKRKSGAAAPSVAKGITEAEVEDPVALSHKTAGLETAGFLGRPLAKKEVGRAIREFGELVAQLNREQDERLADAVRQRGELNEAIVARIKAGDERLKKAVEAALRRIRTPLEQRSEAERELAELELQLMLREDTPEGSPILAAPHPAPAGSKRSALYDFTGPRMRVKVCVKTWGTPEGLCVAHLGEHARVVIEFDVAALGLSAPARARFLEIVGPRCKDGRKVKFSLLKYRERSENMTHVFWQLRETIKEAHKADTDKQTSLPLDRIFADPSEVDLPEQASARHQRVEDKIKALLGDAYTPMPARGPAPIEPKDWPILFTDAAAVNDDQSVRMGTKDRKVHRRVRKVVEDDGNDTEDDERFQAKK
jgi:hypothetical protein